MMNYEDTLLARSIQKQLLHSQSMRTMLIAMAVERSSLPETTKKEVVQALQTLQSNGERILGQDVTASGKRWETSKRESPIGLKHLSTVLDNLASDGLLNEVSVGFISNDSGSDIREIILSFRSSAEPRSEDTSGERTRDTLIRDHYQNIEMPKGRVPFSTDLPPVPEMLWSAKES